MLSRAFVRSSPRAALRLAASATAAPPRHGTAALLHTTRPLSLPPKGGSPVPGGFARTDDNITVEYPEEGELPSSVPIQGRGGMHMKRTLASFSLEGKVGVVTGGARGLGLVMGQGMVISGANLAIVDMNSTVFPLPPVHDPKALGNPHIHTYTHTRTRTNDNNTDVTEFEKQRRRPISRPLSSLRCSAERTRVLRECPR